MNDKILTISIAAYNVEKYIKNTLDSLIVDEIINDIEVLVIDDGGKDKSLDIAKSYELKYPNSIKAIHKENGGYGSTVNYAIKIANGKYFKLLDGDDWFERDGVVSLVHKLKQIDVDMVVTNFKKVYQDRTIDGLALKNVAYDTVINIENLNINEGIPMHAVTYKTSVLRDSNLKLREHLLYTDNYYVSIPLICVKNVVFYDFNVYNYRLGQIGQSMDRDVALKNMHKSEIISYDLAEFYGKLNTDNIPARKYLCRRIASSCSDHFATAIKQPISTESLNYIKNFDSKIKNYSIDVFNTMATLDRNASRVIKLVRASNYILYWPIALLFRII